MKLMNLKVLYFSPVGTTKKVAEMIADGLEVESVDWIDLSVPSNRMDGLIFSADDVVLMAFPVYAGRVVRVPRYYFKQIEGNGARSITVVTYGNRAYDDALLELSRLSAKSGFEQVAAAAFVCEHSFDIGLAAGRPDISDCDIAVSFGKTIKQRLLDGKVGPKMEGIIDTIPGQFPFRTQFRHDFGGPLVPETSEDCINCGKCAKHCPVEAIPLGNPMVTDSKKCITCYRCIRHCPVQARKINLPDFIDHAEWLADNYKTRKEPELYL